MAQAQLSSEQMQRGRYRDFRSLARDLRAWNKQEVLLEQSARARQIPSTQATTAIEAGAKAVFDHHRDKFQGEIDAARRASSHYNGASMFFLGLAVGAWYAITKYEPFASATRQVSLTTLSVFGASVALCSVFAGFKNRVNNSIKFVQEQWQRVIRNQPDAGFD
jgi:hypothetical protein